MEGVALYRGWCHRFAGNGGEMATVAKGGTSNALYTCGNGEDGEAVAMVEGRVSNACYPIVFAFVAYRGGDGDRVGVGLRPS